MPTNDQDIRALEYLAIRLRKETYGAGPWDEHGTHIVFTDHLTRLNLGVAMDLVLRHAQDPDAKTPAAIKRQFRPEPPKQDHRWSPPKRDEECPTHPGQRATSCGGCAADRHADPDEAPEPTSNARELAHAQLAQALANVCRHGVRATHCTDCGNEPKTITDCAESAEEEKTDASL